MNPDTEALAKILQTIGNDASLRNWFFSLEGKSTAWRNRELAMLSERMKARNEDARLVEALQWLREETLFQAALQTMRELER